MSNTLKKTFSDESRSGIRGNRAAHPDETGVRPDLKRLEAIRDDTLLSRSAEADAWDYTMEYLRRTPEATLESLSEGNVGFFELDQQAAAYRGRIVSFTGRILRCEYHPDPERLAREKKASGTTNAYPGDPFATVPSRDFYLCFVRMADNKEIPLTLCVQEVPEGFPVRQTLNETVHVTGVFYKNRYYGIEEDVYSSPTVLAGSFHWAGSVSTHAGERDLTAIQREVFRKYGVWVALGVILILWFFTRRHFLRVDARRREKRLAKRSPTRFRLPAAIDPPETSQESPGDTNRPDEGETILPSAPGLTGKEVSARRSTTLSATFFTMFSTAMFALFGLYSLPCIATAFARETEAEEVFPRIDAALVQTMMKLDAQQWDLLDENVDLSGPYRPALLELESRLLYRIPYSVLEHGVEPVLLGAKEGTDEKLQIPPSRSIAARRLATRRLTDDPAQFRGKVFRFQNARAVWLEESPLSGEERASYRNDYRFDKLYRCRVILEDGGTAIVYTPQVPREWPVETNMAEPCAATGVYLQRFLAEPLPGTDVDVTESDSFDSDLAVVIASPRLEWYPTDWKECWSPLIPNGLDVGTLDAIPNVSLADLSSTGSPGRPRLDRESLRRALWFTDADRDPFYQILRAVDRLKPGTLNRFTGKRLKAEDRFQDGVFDLFQHPETQRGKLVRLSGVAKRVIPTLINDPEITGRYMITRYYQIYLYTHDSQGNPLVVCVPNLPKGMPSGTASNYGEQISVSAYFYKLWAYEAAAPAPSPDEDGRHGTGSGGPDSNDPAPTKPRYAPLLIGGDVEWTPREQTGVPDGSTGNPGSYGGTTVLVVLLLLLWLYFRFGRRPPRQAAFRFGAENDPGNKGEQTDGIRWRVK